MSDNQEQTNDQEQINSIIESYDGDPDDLFYFQAPKGEEYEDLEDYEEDGYEEDTEVVFERETAFPEGGSTQENVEPEVIYEVQKPISEISETQNSPTEVLYGDVLPQSNNPMQGIDLNDPHYANFKLDPYYDFGQGPEPKAKGMNDKKDGEGLGIASLSCGIGSMLFMCCGIQYIFSVAALITGIWCLCLKMDWNKYKTMSVIGIVCALFPIFLQVVGLFMQIALMAAYN